MNRVIGIGFWLLLSVGGAFASRAAGQDSAPSALPDVEPLAPAGRSPFAGTTTGAVNTFSEQKVTPLTEGPLHEAFLSPRKDHNPGASRKLRHRHYPSAPASTRRAQVRSGSKVTGNGTPAATTSSG